MTMMSLLLSTVVILAAICNSSSSPAFTRALSGPNLFGIGRGGGLFGGKEDKKENAKVSESDDTSRPKYPAMTRDEVEEWLEHIPVFAVTDGTGAGVVLKPDNDTSVLYFFMNPLMANSTLQQLKAVNENMDLRVSAFSLGKIWFKLLSSDADQEVLLKNPNEEGEGTVAKGVQYRLVPDTRDLLGARMLLTMTPEDGEKLRESGQMTPEIAQAAIQKAMTEATKFNSTYNEIPVFMIAQMRMQKKLEEGETGEPVTLLPMYFSMQSMVGTWQQFMAQAPQDLQGVEPSINLMSLHDLVEMMLKESEIDFRNVVLVPPTPLTTNSGVAEESTIAAEDPLTKMGGSTLGDI